MKLCTLNIHRWNYITATKRRCIDCGKTQVKSGSFWKNV